VSAACAVLILVPSAGADDASVVIRSSSFQPHDVRVPVGGTVAWTNEDPTAHTVTADDGSFDSGGLEQGEGFSRTFDDEAIHEYFCSLHPGMRGAVLVGDAQPTPSPVPTPRPTPSPCLIQIGSPAGPICIPRL
jgi:plastocyanin